MYFARLPARVFSSQSYCSRPPSRRCCVRRNAANSHKNRACLSGWLPNRKKRRGAKSAEVPQRVSDKGFLRVSPRPLRLCVYFHAESFHFGKQPDKQGIEHHEQRIATSPSEIIFQQARLRVARLVAGAKNIWRDLDFFCGRRLTKWQGQFSAPTIGYDEDIFTKPNRAAG